MPRVLLGKEFIKNVFMREMEYVCFALAKPIKIDSNLSVEMTSGNDKMIDSQYFNYVFLKPNAEGGMRQNAVIAKVGEMSPQIPSFNPPMYGIYIKYEMQGRAFENVWVYLYQDVEVAEVEEKKELPTKTGKVENPKKSGFALFRN